MKGITLEPCHDLTKIGRIALRGGCSALAMGAFLVAAPGHAQTLPANESTEAAQTTTVQEEDEIIVTGYRQSLQSAQDIKRNSDVIVDSITATDIGALPDRSVTEALQRIPGVTINRFAAGVDPDHFSVEGSGVVVRGLTYVRSEFNGREAFSASNGRALSFADVPSELLGGVDVFKSPSADRIEGGIAGVVNLRTRKPFDATGLVVAGSLEMNYGDFINKGAPTGSILFSDRFSTGIGEIGILGSVVYSQLFSRADRLQISSFRQRNLYSDGDVNQNGDASIVGPVLFPRGATMGTQEFDRQRRGFAGALQWQSPDGSMEAVFQFLRSDARQAWTERNIEIATDNVSANGDSRRVEGTELEFDDDGLFDNGLITGPTGWRADQFTADPRTPILGLQSNNIRRDHYEKLVTEDYGFNFKWDVSDRIGIVFDYQHVGSSGYVIDNGLWMSSYQNVFIDLDGSNLPTVEFLPPQVCSGPAQNSTCDGAPGSQNSPTYFGAGHTSFTDPYNSFYRSAMDHIEDSTGDSDALRLDAEMAFPESGFLQAIRVGARYADRQQTNRFSTYNWGRLSEQWGNDGPVWLDDNVDGVPGGNGGSPAGNYEPYFFPQFFQGQVGNPMVGDGRLFYSQDTARNYEDYVAFGRRINSEWEAPVVGPDGVTRRGWNGLAGRFGTVDGGPFLPGEINPLREENIAAYAMARFDTEFGNGMKLNGNVGLRYTKTDRTSVGGVAFPYPGDSFPTEEQCNVTDNIPNFCFLSPEERQAARTISDNAFTPSTAKLSYEYWLPSVNVKLEVGDGIQFRGAYFKGVSPPATGLTRNFFNASFGPVANVDENGNIIPQSFRLQGTFGIGNPYLLPVEADNFDLTAEWYFDDVGQITVSGFYKRLKNVLTNSTTRQDVTNNGATVSSVISQPINADGIGEIKGVEVAYQQTYDFLPGIFSGLGLQANYTYIESTGVPQSTLSETDPDVGAGRVTTVDLSALPLQGLSKHAFTVTPFLDIGKLSMRASYSWRDDFLLTIRDVIFPNDPIINKAGGQVDASIFYDITENFKLGVQAVNLNNQVTKTTAVVQDVDGGTREVPRGWYINDRRFTLAARFNF
ncbi:TonB-dependent receptor [Sphingomonas japonica]|uniref:TonB-dependent receptor n=1 Tax=Sphingomonas japonica TaxID=511662 RepID=A0ABX0TXM3_9SPHN|nr:TonB-dependent receptor [Sphingomonas japonica]NIJ23048.1 TonB-dependent receptor [Sphingomonas japonica]